MNFPKFINPGLEFYVGASLAIDSLNAERVPLEIHVYDTRSVSQPLSQVLQSEDFKQTDLIIGHVTAAELHEIAPVSAKMHVPFINVNFPNDGGITDNPDYVILNSTLRTHCEAIYKFLQRNHPLEPIFVLRKRGLQEDRLQNYFTDIEKNTASVPLKLKFVNLADPPDLRQITPLMDSTRKNIFIVASLDEKFAIEISSILASVSKTYPVKIIGMPTWDNLTELTQPEFNDLEILFTTPFYINPSDSLASYIQANFRNKFYARPSDMVFRGFETMYHFGKLLHLYGRNLSGSIGEKKFRVFNDFDIEPVFLNKQNMVLDYFENKRIYFVRRINGVTTVVTQ
jgi:hypothetical protein